MTRVLLLLCVLTVSVTTGEGSLLHVYGSVPGLQPSPFYRMQLSASKRHYANQPARPL